MPRRYVELEAKSWKKEQSILDSILAILAIVVTFIGIPLLILWIKDRGGTIGIIIKRILGLISFSFGIIIIGWFLYNLLYPTKVFREHYHSIFQLIVPIGFIYMGWEWLIKEEPGLEEQNIDFNSPELLEREKNQQDNIKTKKSIN